MTVCSFGTYGHAQGPESISETAGWIFPVRSNRLVVVQHHDYLRIFAELAYSLLAIHIAQSIRLIFSFRSCIELSRFVVLCVVRRCCAFVPYGLAHRPECISLKSSDAFSLFVFGNWPDLQFCVKCFHGSCTFLFVGRSTKLVLIHVKYIILLCYSLLYITYTKYATVVQS